MIDIYHNRKIINLCAGYIFCTLYIHYQSSRDLPAYLIIYM